VESGAKTCNTIAEIKGVNWVVRGTQKKNLPKLWRAFINCK